MYAPDESSIGKESDEEDNEGARVRRDQLTALKEAAYELLGKGWPKSPDTQEKYQEIFFTHCAKSYPMSSRSTQLAMLSSIARVLPLLSVLSRHEPMDVDNAVATNRDKAAASVVSRVAEIIEYTLKNSNTMRHRKDALNLMEILIKQLKEISKTEEIEKLKAIYQTYAQDLAKDSSHELRSKVDSIKVLLK